MKTAYLLTLAIAGEKEPIGKLLLIENDIDLIIKGINVIENQQGEYYETYAKEIVVYGDPKFPQSGVYKDTVRWADMIWDIEEMKILDYTLK